MKILGKLSEETKGPLMKLHSCLNGKVRPFFYLFPASATSSAGLLTVCSPQTIEDFLTNIETCAEVCGFMLKKGDKKKER